MKHKFNKIIFIITGLVLKNTSGKRSEVQSGTAPVLLKLTGIMSACAWTNGVQNGTAAYAMYTSVDQFPSIGVTILVK